MSQLLPRRPVQLPGPRSSPSVPAPLTCSELPRALSRLTARCVCQGWARQRKHFFFFPERWLLCKENKVHRFPRGEAAPTRHWALSLYLSWKTCRRAGGSPNTTASAFCDGKWVILPPGVSGSSSKLWNGAIPHTRRLQRYVWGLWGCHRWKQS